jgi:hypothetical protein
MGDGPSLIFDKSSLESLNLDEAVLMDNFYMSNITPLFFVECLADLEKEIRSKSTPEQLVGSLADRTPEYQSNPNAHHMAILSAELAGTFDGRWEGWCAGVRRLKSRNDEEVSRLRLSGGVR